MVNGIEILLNYLKKYRELEVNSDNSKAVLKIIDNTIDSIDNRRYLVDFDVFEKLAKKYEKSDIDSILNEIILNVNRYNIYLMNKKIKFALPNLDIDIPLDEVKIDISDILNYLEIKEEDLNASLVKDLKKFIEKDKFQDFAKSIKTSNDLERVLFDKIVDKDILVSILLHSNIELVRNVINIFKEKEVNINKVVTNIPTIFIKEKINNSCKYDVLCHYDSFTNNYKLLEEYGIDFKKVMKFPVFFLNDVENNKKLIDKLIEKEIKPSNILENVGNMFVLNPETIFNNIDTLKFHGVDFKDEEDTGYTIIGMSDLDSQIDYLIEKGLWKNGE